MEMLCRTLSEQIDYNGQKITSCDGSGLQTMLLVPAGGLNGARFTIILSFFNIWLIR